MELVSGESGKRRAPVRQAPAFRKPVVNVLQPELLPPTLDEMVPADDPSRLVVKLVALLDLSALTQRLSLQGAPHYPLKVMLAIEMLCRWDGEFGSRRVEKRCKYDTRYKWVAQGHEPDHSTIWRFRRFLGEGMDELLAESVQLGKKAGLESLGRASIDGTKLPGALSQWRKFRKACEQADQELTCEFEGESASSFPVEPQSNSATVPESNNTLEPGDEITTEPAAEPAPCAELSAEELALKIIERSVKTKSKREALPPKDPDARTLLTRQGHYIRGYNAQFIVDRDTELVMAVHVTNQASDAALMEPTLAHYLELNKDLPCDLLADAGYDTPNNAQVLSDLGIDACVACKERNPFWRLDEQNRPLCPANHLAVFQGDFPKNGVQVTRLVVNECPSCPLAAKCLTRKGSNNKTISFDAKADVAIWIAQKHKAKSEEGKARLKERGRTMEFGFARMKQRFKLRRLSMWRLKGAQIEVGIMALAMNLALIGAAAKMAGLDKLLAELLLSLCTLWRAIGTYLGSFKSPRPQFCHSQKLLPNYSILWI